MSTDPGFTFGDRLAKARHLAGLTQHDMAEALFVSRTTINNWEREHATPSPRKVQAWADVTGVRVEWLRGEARDRRRDDSFPSSKVA